MAYTLNLNISTTHSISTPNTFEVTLQLTRYIIYIAVMETRPKC